MIPPARVEVDNPIAVSPWSSKPVMRDREAANTLIASEMLNMKVWVQRLFAEFPSGPPAAGLLLLRSVLGLVILLRLSVDSVLTTIAALLLIAGCVSLALVGPGAWSVDARFFGRREVVIPRRHP